MVSEIGLLVMARIPDISPSIAQPVNVGPNEQIDEITRWYFEIICWRNSIDPSDLRGSPAPNRPSYPYRSCSSLIGAGCLPQSTAISCGANIKAVQRMLGHEKANVTLDVYGHLYTEDLERVADTIDERLRDAA